MGGAGAELNTDRIATEEPTKHLLPLAVRDRENTKLLTDPFRNFLVPHFDSANVLDYVLRSPVVAGDSILEDGLPAPKMFGELLSRLRGIRSPKIQQYIAHRFPNQPLALPHYTVGQVEG
jgi:hypothetical protein